MEQNKIELAPKIGWIGLGKMGIPMAKKLMASGYSLVVNNRNKEKEVDLKSIGALVSTSPGQLFRDTEIIFVMVSDDEAIREIFYAENGILMAGSYGKIVINMSTVSPEISREIATELQKRDNHYLDAPVSGSVKQAEEGQLVIMVGGKEEVFNKVKTILDCMGKLSIRLGGTGAGNIAKLAVNTFLAIVSEGLGEAATLAKQNGIQTSQFFEILNQSALGSPFIRIKGEAIMKEDYRAAFALKHIAKDLRLADKLNFTGSLSRRAFQSFQDAEASIGEEDIIAIIKALT